MMDQDKKLELLKWAREFRDAAVADGWKIEPAYTNEDVSSASHLTKNGFKMTVITRDHPAPFIRNQRVIQGTVNIWGPDGLAIDPPQKYSWDLIEKGLRKFSFCHGGDKETFRVGFADRACQDCLPKARKKLETPGWYN